MKLKRETERVSDGTLQTESGGEAAVESTTAVTVYETGRIARVEHEYRTLQRWPGGGVSVLIGPLRTAAQLSRSLSHCGHTHAHTRTHKRTNDAAE